MIFFSNKTYKNISYLKQRGTNNESKIRLALRVLISGFYPGFLGFLFLREGGGEPYIMRRKNVRTKCA